MLVTAELRDLVRLHGARLAVVEITHAIGVINAAAVELGDEWPEVRRQLEQAHRHGLECWKYCMAGCKQMLSDLGIPDPADVKNQGGG